MKILFMSLSCFVTTIVCGQSIGTKVKMKATDAKEYTGVIIGIEGDKFRVKYDGTEFDALLLSTQFTVVTKNYGENTGAQNTGTKNTGYKVGDKITAKDRVGNWLPAEILEIGNGQYKIHYTGYTDYYDGFIPAGWIKPLNAKTPAANNTTTGTQNNNAENTGTQNTGYKVGDKITAKDRVNNWLPAEIMEIGNGRYKVHYTGYTDYYDGWIPADWIKPLNAKTPATNNSNTEQAKDPEMNGAIPKIVGTAWYCLAIYNKGTTPKNNHVHFPYIFFKDGNYEVQSGGYFSKGKYRVSGNKITQVSDGSDKLTETYTITWNAKEKYMELTSTSGPTVIRLTYNRKTSS